MASPDLTGFAEAQDRLRQTLGVDVIFLIPIPPVYAAGVQLDPESGKPFDPTIEPVSGGGHATMTKRCSIFQGLTRQILDSTEEQPAGALRGENLMVGLKSADYPDVDDATGMIVADEEYALTEFIQDPAFNLNLRYLVFGEAR